MIQLKTTKTVVPGGWIYNQLDASGKLIKNFSSMGPLSLFCADILDCRKGNNLPGATMVEVEQDVISATCQRLGNNPDYCYDTQKKTTFLNGLSHLAQHAVNEIKNKISGAAILADMLGGVPPVAAEQSQARADICTGRLSGTPCPRHTPDWNFTLKAAQVIKDQMAAKAEGGLQVIGEDKLKVCNVCGCWLPLKVHVPFKTIWKHTSDSQFDEFPSNCWLAIERQLNKSPA